MTIDPTFLDLLPIDGQTFARGTRAWRARVTGTPDEKRPNNGDNLRYRVSFALDGNGTPERTLDLWLSEIGLRGDTDGSYKREVVSSIGYWLDRDELSGSIRYIGLTRRAA